MSREMRFGEDAGTEIIKAVRETNRRMRNAEPYRGRWFNRSGAGSKCELSYDLRIFWNPQAGTVEVGVTYNSVFESFDIAYNATAAEVGDELSTHSELVAESKTISVITAGPLPSSNMIIVVPEGVTLTRGSNTLVRRAASPTPEYRLDTCCAS